MELPMDAPLDAQRLDAQLDLDHVLETLERLLRDRQGRCFSELQRAILQQVWQGRRYFEIADSYGCTEGHAKDVGAQLWRQLSELCGEKVTKRNLRATLGRGLDRARGIKQRLRGPSPSPLTARVPDLPPSPALPNCFVGREAALGQLAQQLQINSAPLVIQGEGGLGKTTLARQFLQRCLERSTLALVLESPVAKEALHLVSPERIVGEWLLQQFEQQPSEDFGINLARLRQALQQHPCGVFIDNLETALDSQGQFVAGQRGYVELLRMLGDAGVVTILTSRDRLCEPGLSLNHYRLPQLDLAAWQRFFALGLGQAGVLPAKAAAAGMSLAEVGASPAELAAIASLHRAYGGNAKAMGLLCAAVAADFGGDLRAYQAAQGDALPWLLDLEQLINHQVERLRQLDPAAYQLFCRLGCYRYQELERLPLGALTAQLWDVEPARRLRVIDGLQRRSLIEVQDQTYGLHPALRAVAAARLRSSPDWCLAHRAALAHWRDSIERITQRQDALVALEAYHHAIALEDFGQAAQLLLQSRLNQWNQFLPLGSSLYRLGWVQPTLRLIEQLIPRLGPSPQRAELLNILGDLYSIRGELGAAIAAQSQAQGLAEQQLRQLDSAGASHPPTQRPGQPPEQPPGRTISQQRHYLTMLSIDAGLSLGLYRLDQGALDLAQAHFSQVMAQAQGTAHQPWADKARICLALVHCEQGEAAAARHLLGPAEATPAEPLGQLTQRFGPDHSATHGAEIGSQIGPKIGPGDRPDQGLGKPSGQVERWAYFVQILGRVYAALDQPALAERCYDLALQAAHRAHYPQVQARAQLGLAELRQRQRHYEMSLQLVEAAMATLAPLGAICDLAQAQFQLALLQSALGLAVTQRGDRPPALEQAIAYLTQAQAPQRIAQFQERWQRAMAASVL